MDTNKSKFLFYLNLSFFFLSIGMITYSLSFIIEKQSDEYNQKLIFWILIIGIIIFIITLYILAADLLGEIFGTILMSALIH